MIIKIGETRMNAGTAHPKSKVRFQIEMHQRLDAEFPVASLPRGKERVDKADSEAEERKVSVLNLCPPNSLSRSSLG